MRPIRVARIITRLNVGGPAYQAVILNHILEKDCGYNTLLICGSTQPDEDFFSEILSRYPVRIYFCPHLTRNIAPYKDLRSFFYIRDILRRFKPHLVHTHTAKAGLVGRLAAACEGIPAIHTFHGHVFRGYFPSYVGLAFVGAERILARCTERIIAISESQRKELIQTYRIADPAKVVTVELGVPLERFLKLPSRGWYRRLLGVPEDAIIIGSMGRLVAIKNFNLLIRILSELTRVLPSLDIRLFIAGKGLLKDKLERLTRELGMGDRVYFLGSISDLERFYADIDIFILTSINEGTPVALLEAVSSGVISVAADVGGIRDVLPTPPHRLVNSNLVCDYVDIVRQIIEDLERHRKAAQSLELRRSIVYRFSVDRLVADIDRLYKDLLGQRQILRGQNQWI